MSEKDYQLLLELAKKKLSKEEGFRLLVECGLLTEEGYLVNPDLEPYFTSKTPSPFESRQ